MENLRDILTKEEFDELLFLPQNLLENISRKIQEEIVSTEKNVERKFQTQLRKQQSSFGFKLELFYNLYNCKSCYKNDSLKKNKSAYQIDFEQNRLRNEVDKLKRKISIIEGDKKRFEKQASRAHCDPADLKAVKNENER